MAIKILPPELAHHLELWWSFRQLRQVLRVSRSVDVRPLAFEPETVMREVSLSPDGFRAAVATSDGSMWIYDLRRQNWRKRFRTGTLLTPIDSTSRRRKR